MGYGPNTLDYFFQMFLEAKKSYPELELSDCICSKVTKSSWNFGYTLLAFSVNEKKPGWDIYDGEIDFYYS